jgi:glyoxylase-like metal-dependent hydrolase (beta-lactamase superfamily II)
MELTFLYGARAVELERSKITISKPEKTPEKGIPIPTREENDKKNVRARTSFQVVYDDKNVIIEFPFDRVLYDKFCGYRLLGIKGKHYNEENYEIIQEAMLEAECIVATHEHWDHVGSIAQCSRNLKIGILVSLRSLRMCAPRARPRY